VVTIPARLPLTGTPVAHVGYRSASLAAWATAYLQGSANAGDVIVAVTGRDEPHVVDGLVGGVDLAALLTDLRGRGISGLRLVLSVPGDPRGLPGPGPLSDAALLAGEAVRVQGDGIAYGLVPTITEHGNALDGRAVTVRWQVFVCAGAAPEPAGTGRQAEHELTDALRVAAATLAALDVARLGPQEATALSRVRSARSAVTLPPGHPGAGLWAQADRLAWIVDLAAADDGAAYDRFGAVKRRGVLRGLAGAVRRAKTAAINGRLDLPEQP
jgi:hypothetical protein